MFAEQVLAVLLWAILGFVIVLELAMPWVMSGFAPGFVRTPEQFDLAVLLTRITFPYLLFISLVSLLAGVLNSLGRFAAAAATHRARSALDTRRRAPAPYPWTPTPTSTLNPYL